MGAPAAYEWRYVVTDKNCGPLVWLDRLATARELLFTLNAPAWAKGEVPSDEPQVNQVHTDGDPFLNHNNRRLFGFRRESDSAPFWTCRFGGIIEINEDGADTNSPITTFTAYDPWGILNRRPLLTNSGTFPGRDGLSYGDTRGNVIALALLGNTIAANGSCHIDMGQTAFYGGTIVPTAKIDISFQRGLSVGEAWTQLCDTATIDIVLDPVFDINRPGIIAEVSIYPQAGAVRHNAVFGWDRGPRSLVGLSRLTDGSQLANKVLFYDDKAVPAQVQTDAASVTKFGENWKQDFFPGQSSHRALDLLAVYQLAMLRRGKRTYTISPAPERGPVPFLDYYLGDEVPVVSSARLREAVGTTQRIFGLPVQLDDSGKETVRELLVAPPNA